MYKVSHTIREWKIILSPHNYYKYNSPYVFFTLLEILFDLKKMGVMRNEPVLVVGGGVIADIAGFALALFHRNTPYVVSEWWVDEKK